MTHVKALRFSKYKAFADEQRLELRPITLLFGKNSAGKSAALRLIKILADAARPRTSANVVRSVFDYEAPALRGATFDEITYGRSGTTRLAIEWSDSSFSFALRQPDKRRGEIISDFDLIVENQGINGLLTSSPQDPRYTIVQGPGTKDQEWKFLGLSPMADAASAHANYAAKLCENLSSLAASTYWIGSVRAQPPRYFTFGPGTNLQIEHEGTGVAQALRASALANDGVVEAVSEWLSTSSGYEMTLSAIDGEAVLGRQWYPFDVNPAQHSASIAVRDVGEGVAQALPIVTLCHQARLGLLGSHPVLAFEQPELHLHPRAAVQLAEMIVSCVVAGSPASHIIETHSESFLLSLQIALASKNLRPDQVMIYWVEAERGQSRLRPIELDESGYPAEGAWPEGVFREALELARRLADLRLS